VIKYLPDRPDCERSKGVARPGPLAALRIVTLSYRSVSAKPDGSRRARLRELSWSKRVTQPKLDYRYPPVPIEMFNDDRLDPVDVKAWGIMWDASRAWLSTISERRLGQRLRRSEDTVRRIIRRLAAAGWIEIVDHGNGRCRDYRLLTPATNATSASSSDVKTPGVHAGGSTATPSTDAPDRSHPSPKTPSVGAAQPRDYLDIHQEHEVLENRNEIEITAEQARQNIARLKALATALCEKTRTRGG
jgi:DNA-binding MarR family transcriptional regulator